jgi:hypothetical protein
VGDKFLDILIREKRLVTVLIDPGTFQGPEPVFEVMEGMIISGSSIGIGFINIDGARFWLPLHTVVRIMEKDNTSEYVTPLRVDKE